MFSRAEIISSILLFRQQHLRHAATHRHPAQQPQHPQPPPAPVRRPPARARGGAGARARPRPHHHAVPGAPRALPPHQPGVQDGLQSQSGGDLNAGLGTATGRVKNQRIKSGAEKQNQQFLDTLMIQACARIFKQSMEARNRVLIGLPHRPASRARIFKRLWSPGIDS
jgi:hypothetical protein